MTSIELGRYRQQQRAVAPKRDPPEPERDEGAEEDDESDD